MTKLNMATETPKPAAAPHVDAKPAHPTTVAPASDHKATPADKPNVDHVSK